MWLPVRRTGILRLTQDRLRPAPTRGAFFPVHLTTGYVGKARESIYNDNCPVLWTRRKYVVLLNLEDGISYLAENEAGYR